MVARYLEDARVDVDAVDRNGNSALHLAAQGGHRGHVRRLLLDKRTDATLVNKVGKKAGECCGSDARMAELFEGLLSEDNENEVALARVAELFEEMNDTESDYECEWSADNGDFDSDKQELFKLFCDSDCDSDCDDFEESD